MAAAEKAALDRQVAKDYAQQLQDQADAALAADQAAADQAAAALTMQDDGTGLGNFSGVSSTSPIQGMLGDSIGLGIVNMGNFDTTPAVNGAPASLTGAALTAALLGDDPAAAAKALAILKEIAAGEAK